MSATAQEQKTIRPIRPCFFSFYIIPKNNTLARAGPQGYESILDITSY